MTSKLVSLARVAFLSKAAAAAARSAPGVIIGPLQVLFGSGKAADDDDDDEEHKEDGMEAQEQDRDENENQNGVMLSEEATTNRNPTVFSALVAEAEARAGTTTTTTTTTTRDNFSALAERASNTGTEGPMSMSINPFAGQELLRDFQSDYYRQAIAGNDALSPESALDCMRDRVEDPDLSIPVGEEYLHLAQ